MLGILIIIFVAVMVVSLSTGFIDPQENRGGIEDLDE